MTSDPSKMQGVRPRSGARTNNISMFTLQTPHVSKLSLSSPFFLINVSQKLGLWEPILSITGRTAGNPRPSGYGLLVHQRDQNRFAHTPSFCELDHEKNRKAPKTSSKKEETKKWFATTKDEDLFIFAQIHRLQNNIIMKRANVLLNSKD